MDNVLVTGARFSSQKAEKELGWKPIDIKQSIKDTVSWVKQYFLPNQ